MRTIRRADHDVNESDQEDSEYEGFKEPARTRAKQFPHALGSSAAVGCHGVTSRQRRHNKHRATRAQTHDRPCTSQSNSIQPTSIAVSRHSQRPEDDDDVMLEPSSFKAEQNNFPGIDDPSLLAKTTSVTWLIVSASNQPELGDVILRLPKFSNTDTLYSKLAMECELRTDMVENVSNVLATYT